MLSDNSVNTSLRFVTKSFKQKNKNKYMIFYHEILLKCIDFHYSKWYL